MSRKPASTKVTEDCTMRVLGGREMTMKEYAEYMQALSAKPFLTVHEASIFFNIGVNKLYKLMKDPSCDYVVDAGHLKQNARIHRLKFEEWLLTNGGKNNEED